MFCFCFNSYNEYNLFLNLQYIICGIVCLDGSLPAYHLHRGFGAGTNNWLLQFEVIFILLQTHIIVTENKKKKTKCGSVVQKSHLGGGIER